MKFFIDTADLDQIEAARQMGILDGVTTNPSLMAAIGIRGERNILDHYVRICEIVDGDVSAEVLSTGYEEMVEEGVKLSALHPNIVVKIPCTADGLKAVKALSDRDIRTNCTLIFTVGQALMAAKAGASYVSPFVGRLDDAGGDGVGLVGSIVEVFGYYGAGTEVLAASIRSVDHITRCMKVGADVVTTPLKFMEALLKHPLTDIGMDIFIRDAGKLL